MNTHPNGSTAAEPEPQRAALVRRAALLNKITLTYNCAEAVIAMVAGWLAGSIALFGFGIDSVVEVSASVAALWRLRADHDLSRRERSERIALRLIGACFLALAVYVAWEAIETLWNQEKPSPSLVGSLLTTASVIVMPVLARAKRRVAIALRSGALAAEAQQTAVCCYLSVIVLAGLLLNAWLGWWWADPVAALAMVPLIAYEGVQGLRGQVTCQDCCTHGPAGCES